MTHTSISRRRDNRVPQDFRGHRFAHEVSGAEFHGVDGEFDRRKRRDHNNPDLQGWLATLPRQSIEPMVLQEMLAAVVTSQALRCRWVMADEAFGGTLTLRDGVAGRAGAVRNTLPGPEVWLVLRRPLQTGELQTSLYNAPVDTAMEKLVHRSGMR